MTDHRVAIANHPDFLQYDFGPNHPLRPERITAGLSLLTACDLWDEELELLTPEPAPYRDLEMVHDAAYIQAVEAAGAASDPNLELSRFGLGVGDNPAFPNMHYAASMVAGGSSLATRQIMSGALDHAFNPAGGLHHAGRSRASGFCIYDDPALAAAIASREFGARVLYVDFDCHHGDGVQWIFYDDPRVLTMSFHESGRYLFPGTGSIEEMGVGEGYGYSANIPMEPFTGDDSWIEALREVVPVFAERFQPDLIISAHGADTHSWDPLTDLSLTTDSFMNQARLAHELAHKYAHGRWLAVGSGGYDWRRVVPRSWAILWCEMSGRELPEALPDVWRSSWQTHDTAMPLNFLDDAGEEPRTAHSEAVKRSNRQTVEELLRSAPLLTGA